MASLLALRGLNVTYSAKPVNVVNQVDLVVREAEIFGLAGESGCGKSLTALAIMGILPGTFKATGEVQFKGSDLLSLPQEEIRRVRGNEISMIFQEPMTSLNPVLKIGKQISEAVEVHLNMPRQEAADLAVQLLGAVRIPSPEIRAGEYPHQMSGGMRQRAMIAMAIACKPSLLIADEPTTALDVTIQAQVLELLRGLRRERNMAVLLITHDLSVIAENASRAAIMYAGRIVETAPVGALFTKPLHPYTVGLLESMPSVKGRGMALNPIPGTVPKPGMLPPGCKFSNRCAYKTEKCTQDEPELRQAATSAGDDDKAMDQIATGHMVRCIMPGVAKWNS